MILKRISSLSCAIVLAGLCCSANAAGTVTTLPAAADSYVRDGRHAVLNFRYAMR